MDLPKVSRKISLFSILLFLLVLITVNILLTAWIILTLRINFQGLGSIETVSNGTRISGTTYVMENMFANRITASPDIGQLDLLGDKSVSLTVVEDTEAAARLTVKPNLEMMARRLTVTDTQGEEILSVTGKRVSLGQGRLAAYSARLDTALQTGLVKSRAGKPLSVQSPTSFLKLEGNRGVDINATSDNLSIKSLNNIDIKTREGQIFLTTGSLYFSNLPILNTSSISESSKTRSYGSRGANTDILNRVLQVCVCGNGKIFLVKPESQCVATKEICQ